MVPTHAKAQGRRAGLVLCVIALIASMFVGWTRVQTDQASREVAVAVDAMEIRELVRILGADSEVTLESAFPGFLGELKELGVTTVGLYEYTIGDALRDGRAFVVSKMGLSLLSPALVADITGEVWTGMSDERLIIGWPRVDEPIAAWLADGLRRQIEPISRLLLDEGPVELWALNRNVDFEQLSFLTLGFHPGELAAVSQAGLNIAPRFVPDQYAGKLTFQERVNALVAHPVAAVVFWGDQVSGYPAHIEMYAKELEKLDAPVGLIEFVQQSGMNALAKARTHDVVRVHSITEREMAAGIPRDVAVDRWLRAVRERGIRLLYVRLYPTDPAETGSAEIDPAEADASGSYLSPQNRQYIENLFARLKAEGYALGRPNPVAHRPHDPIALGLVVLAVGAVAGILAFSLIEELKFLGIRAVSRMSWVVGGAAFSMLFWFLWFKGYTVLARQTAAFVTAVIFPVMATRAGGLVAARGSGTSEPTARLRLVLYAFAAATAWSLLGAAFMVTLLDDSRFIAGLEGFRGVKAAHVIPLLLTAWLLWPKDRGTLRRTAQLLGSEAGAANCAGVRIWLRLALVVLVGMGFVVYIYRTGNQGLPLWHVEEMARRFLEETFGARPRTKEFLIGHPALLLALVGITAGRDRWRDWTAMMATIGTVGQISILNTFAHAHSPVLLSLGRTVYGWMLGLMIGMIMWAIVHVVVAVSQSRSSGTGGPGKPWRGSSGGDSMRGSMNRSMRGKPQ